MQERSKPDGLSIILAVLITILGLLQTSILITEWDGKGYGYGPSGLLVMRVFLCVLTAAAWFGVVWVWHDIWKGYKSCK